MPTKRQYDTNAARQAAYRVRQAMIPSSTRPCPPARVGYRRWHAVITQARLLLNDVAAEMAAYEAARSDVWRDSERGERFSEHSEMLQDALNLLGDLIEA